VSRSVGRTIRPLERSPITTALVNCSARGTALSHRTYPGSGRRRSTSEIAPVSKRKATQSSVIRRRGRVRRSFVSALTRSSEPFQPPTRPARPDPLRVSFRPASDISDSG
jgi:hypothetical protein